MRELSTITRVRVVYVAIVFVGLVWLPTWAQLRIQNINLNLVQNAAPAERHAEQLRLQLTQGFSDMIGFQSTNDGQYIADYHEVRQNTERTLNDLGTIIRNLPPVMMPTYLDVRTRVEAWERHTDASEVVFGSTPPGTFRDLLFQNQQLVAAARNAVARLEQQINMFADVERERIVRINRYATIATIILSLLGLVAVIWFAALSRRVARLLREASESKEEAQHSADVRDELLRIVSHDLRNPLNLIGLAVRTLKDSPPEPEAHKRYAMIERAVSRMDRLTRDLLDAANIEKGQPLTLARSECIAQQLAREACEFSKAQADQKKQALEFQADNVPQTIHCDADRVLQVLSNLIDNAIKFTPVGGRVQVRCDRLGDVVRFCVADTGSGIDSKDLPNLFRPYWRGSTEQPGAGLGLTISSRIVEEHGGRIRVESEPGLGTTFTFTIPIDQPAIDAKSGRAA